MSDDKTEEPTQHRLREAKKKGQVAKSKDIAMAFTLLGTAIFLSSQSKTVLLKIARFLRSRVTSIGSTEVTIDGFREFFINLVAPMMEVFLPFFFMVLVAGVVGNIIQTGLMFSMESITPKLDKISPIEGFKRIFSAKGLMEFVKVLLKVIVLVVIFRSYLFKNLDKIKLMSFHPVKTILENYVFIVQGLLMRIIGALIVLGILDYGYQRYTFRKQMMMTKQEVKEEYKKTEGDPLVKQRVKMQQREFIKKRMLQGVKESRVVVVNPTHFAVALKYKEDMDEAPAVAAKGKGYIALQIKKLAEKYEIPVVENPPLARAMYAQVEVEEMIPPEMYRAVAEVIAFVEKLKLN